MLPRASCAVAVVVIAIIGGWAAGALAAAAQHAPHAGAPRGNAAAAAGDGGDDAQSVLARVLLANDAVAVAERQLRGMGAEEREEFLAAVEEFAAEQGDDELLHLAERSVPPHVDVLHHMDATELAELALRFEVSEQGRAARRPGALARADCFAARARAHAHAGGLLRATRQLRSAAKNRAPSISAHAR